MIGVFSFLAQRSLWSLILVVLVAPVPAMAQMAPEPDRERITQFAKAFLELAEVKERGFAELSRTHADEPKEVARHELDRMINDVLERYGISKEEYEVLTFLVSAEEAHALVFREVLAEVRAGV